MQVRDGVDIRFGDGTASGGAADEVPLDNALLLGIDSTASTEEAITPNGHPRSGRGVGDHLLFGGPKTVPGGSDDLALDSFGDDVHCSWEPRQCSDDCRPPCSAEGGSCVAPERILSCACQAGSGVSFHPEVSSSIRGNLEDLVLAPYRLTVSCSLPTLIALAPNLTAHPLNPRPVPLRA